MIPNKTIVTWTSGAGGHSKKKSGTILAHIPAGVNAFALPELAKVDAPRYKGNIAVGVSRTARYLIVVDRGESVKPQHRYDYFAPYQGVIDEQNPQAAQAAPAASGQTVAPATAPQWPCARPSAWDKPGAQQAAPTPAPVVPPQPAAPPPPPPVLRNHFVLVVDRSSSITGYRLTDRIRELVNENIETCRRETAQTGQKTTLSIIQFSDRSEVTHHDQDIAAVKPLEWADYRPHGNTALLDAVGLAVEQVSQRRDANDPNLSVVIIALTDGEENASRKYHPEMLRKVMEQTQATGRYTFAFLLPPRKGADFAKRYGIPAGNVREWEQTEAGAVQASQATQAGVSQFYDARSKGATATRSFYTDLSQVKPSDIAKLDDLTPRFRSWQVEKETDIDAFCRFHVNAYVVGAAYYLLTKPEEIQDHKAVVLMEKGKKKVYGGPGVRALLGLPSSGTARVKPGNHANFDIYVQSKSVNRKLVRGTRILYDVEHRTASTPTWVPPAPQTVS